MIFDILKGKSGMSQRIMKEKGINERNFWKPLIFLNHKIIIGKSTNYSINLSTCPPESDCRVQLHTNLFANSKDKYICGNIQILTELVF